MRGRLICMIVRVFAGYSADKLPNAVCLSCAIVVLSALAEGFYWYLRFRPDYPPEYLRTTAWKQKWSMLGVVVSQSVVLAFGQLFLRGVFKEPSIPGSLALAIVCFAFVRLPWVYCRQFAREVEGTIHSEIARLIGTQFPGDLMAWRKAIEVRVNQLYEIFKVEISGARRRPDLLWSDDGLDLRQKLFFLVTYLGRARLASELIQPSLLGSINYFNGQERRSRKGSKPDRAQPDPNSHRWRVYDHLGPLRKDPTPRFSLQLGRL
jgi:hypothetical protein